jgi:hypothetical protein
MATVTNIAAAQSRYTPAEIAARGTVRAHAKLRGLTPLQECTCVDSVTRMMRDGKSAAAAIGEAKQEAERYARSARLRGMTRSNEPQPAA